MNQVICFIFCAIVIYCSFRSLNICTKDTAFIVRCSQILSFTAAVAIMIQLVMGVIPHWTYTLMMAALATKLLSERRRIAVPLPKVQHDNP